MKIFLNKKTILILIFILFVIFVIASLLPKANVVKQSDIKDITPTSFPIPSPQTSNNIEGNGTTNSVNYVGDNKLEQVADTKQTFEPAQEKIKENIIKNAMQNNDYNLVSESDFSINYIQAFDEFQIEILITDYKKAEDEAMNYLRSQGLSDDSICNLPVAFYLSYDVTQQLQGENINVLPEFCK